VWGGRKWKIEKLYPDIHHFGIFSIPLLAEGQDVTDYSAEGIL